jgi:serine protease Do
MGNTIDQRFPKGFQMRLLSLILFFVYTSLQAQTGGVDTPDVYDLWRERVVQIQVIDQQAQTKAGIGSGFFAGKPGWVLTNYHVIADLASQPAQYRARYLAESGQEGLLELLAVDAVHDLAVLKACSSSDAAGSATATQRQPALLNGLPLRHRLEHS